MVVLLYDIAAFTKTKERSEKKSEGQNARNTKVKRTCLRNRNYTKASQIRQISVKSTCHTETDSVTTGHKKRYLHQIHSHQHVGNKVLPDAYAPKYSTETILI